MKHPGEGGNCQSHIIRFKCPVFNSNKIITGRTKKEESIVYSKRKNNSTQTVPEKDLTANILGEAFKTAVLELHKEPQEGVGKVGKAMWEQNAKASQHWLWQ